MRKKVVLVLAVLLTSAAALSLILATSRYVGILSHPEAWKRGLVYQVVEAPDPSLALGVAVHVSFVGGEAPEVSPLLVSTFWIFEVSVVNEADKPVDVDFDRFTLRVADREVWALPTDAVLRLFNERMTGGYAAAAARRGHSEVMEQLRDRKLGVARVFPGYSRTSLVFFQPHPEAPDEAELRWHGVKWVGGGPVAPLTFHLRRDRQGG